MKKIVNKASRFLGLALVLCLLPMLTQESYARQDWVTVDGVEGGKIQFDTDTGFITDCETSVTSVIVPTAINGVPITGIGSRAFYYCSKIEYIYLPDSITVIEEESGYGAFYECESLTKIRLSPNLKEIPHHTFFRCYALQSIDIPDSVTKIGVAAFSVCTKLVNVYIPSGVTEIGNSAFNYCGMLEDVYFGGTEAQWNAMTLGSDNTPLTGAQLTCRSSRPCVVSVNYSTWAKPQLLSAENKGLLTNNLGENYTLGITREQIAELMVNMVEKYTGSTLPQASASTFTDTSNPTILKAYEAGIITGMGESTFAPDESATRQQISVMLYKAITVMESRTNKTLANKNTALSGYNDFDTVDFWAKDAVAILANNKIMTGTSTAELSPHQTTTIEQCVVLVLGSYQL